MAAVEQITTIRSSLDPSGIQKGMQAAVGYVRDGATIISAESGNILAATAKLSKEWINAAAQAQKLVNAIDGQNAALARYTGVFNTMTRGVALGAVQIGVAEKTLESFTQKLGLSSAMLGQNNSIGLTLEQNFKRLVNIFDPIGAAAIKMATATTDLKQAQAAGVTIMGGYQGALENIRVAYEEAAIAGIKLSTNAKESVITIKSATDALALYNEETSSVRQRATALFDPATASAIKMTTELRHLNEARAAGVNISGGYAAAESAIIAKYDEGAVAVKREADATAVLAQQRREAAAAGRADFSADQNQTAFSKSIGVTDKSASSGQAAKSAEVFTEEFDRQAIAIDGANAALDRYFTSMEEGLTQLDKFNADSAVARAQSTDLFDPLTASAMRMVNELRVLNEANAAGRNISGGYAAAYQAIIDKYDEGAIAARQAAAAAALLTAQWKEAAAAGRDAFSADQSQAAFNKVLGVTDSTASTGQAAKSAEVFTQEFDRQAAAIDAANAALDRYLSAIDEGMAELDKFNETSAATRAATTEQFDPATASAMRMVNELRVLNEANEAGRNISGGYAAAYQAIIDKYDEGAVAAKRAADAEALLAEQYRQAAAAGREAFSASQAQADYNKLLGVTSGASSGAAQKSASVFYDEERASVDALYRSSMLYAQEYDKIKNLRASGVIGEDLENSLLDQANTRFARLSTTVDGANDHLNMTRGLTSGVTRELIVLGHEALMGNWTRLGGSTMVMVEFMTQMGGAVGELTKSIVTFALSWKGLATLSVAAFIGGLVLIANAAQSAEVRIGELRNVLSGSRTDFEAAADAAEKAARSVARLNPISTADARASANAISANGFTGTQAQLEQLVVLSAKLSAQLGETAVNAKRAGEIVANPSGVLAEILKANNNNAAFDQNLVTEVKHLQEVGKVGEAVALAYSALSLQTVSVKLKVSELGQAWMDLGKAFTSADSGQKSLAERMGGPILGAVTALIQGVTWLVNKFKELEAVFPELSRTLALVFTFGPLGFIIDKVVNLINLVKGLSSDPAVQAAEARASGASVGEGFLKAGVAAAFPGVGTAVALVPDSAMTAFWAEATQHSNDFWKFAKDTMTTSSGDTWHDIYNVFVTTVLTPFELILSGLRAVVDGFRSIISYLPGGGNVAGGTAFGGPGLPAGPAGLVAPLSSDATDVKAFMVAFLQNQTQVQLNDAAIAAILANVKNESSFNPSLWNPAHTSYGLFQYDVSGGRLQQEQQATGAQEPGILDQLRFFVNDITTGVYAAVGKNLSQLPNTLEGAQAGTAMFTRMFENPKNASQVAIQRSQDAAQFLPPGMTNTMVGAVGGPIGQMTPTQVISAADELAKASAVQKLDEAIKNQAIAQQALEIENAKPQPDPKLVAQYTQVLNDATKARYEAVTATEAVFRAISIETTGQTKLSIEAANGAVAESNMVIRLKAEAEARQLAGGKGDNYLAIANKLTQMYKEQAIAVEAVPLARATHDLQDQIDVMKVENDTIGLDVNERALRIAKIKDDQALQKAYPQQYAANTAAIQQQKDKMVELTLQTQQQQTMMMNLNEAANFVDQTFTTIGGAIVDAFSNGKTAAVNFKDTLTTVVKAILNEFLKLVVIGPLMNYLFGSTQARPTAGGVADALFANSGSGTSTSAGGGMLGLLGTGSSAVSGGSSLLQALGYQGLGGQVNSLFGGPGTSLFAGTGVGDSLSGIGSGALNLLNTPLWGSEQAIANAGLMGYTPLTNAGLGASGATTIGSLLGGVGGGFALGSLSGSLIQGALNKTGPAPEIGAGIGALGGAAIGSVIPGIGTVIGGIIGGLLGGSGGGFIGPHPASAFSSTGVTLQNGQLVVGNSVAQRDPNPGPTTASDAATVNAYLSANNLALTTIGALAQIGQNTPGGFQDPSKFPDIATAFPSFGFSSTDAVLNKYLSGKSYPDMATLQADITKYQQLVNSTIPALTAQTTVTGSLNDAINQINAAFDPAIAMAISFGVATDALTAAQKKGIDAANAAAAAQVAASDATVQANFLSARATVTGSAADAQAAALVTFDANVQPQRDALKNMLVSIYGDTYTSTADFANRMTALNATLDEQRLAIVTTAQQNAATAAQSVVQGNLSSAQSAFNSAQSALVNALNTEISATQSQINALTTNSAALHQAIDGLHAFTASLATSANSPLTPAQQLAAARSQFQTDLAGGVNSVGAAQSDATTVLTLAAAYYGKSTTAYQDIFNSTVSSLTTMENSLRAEATVADKQLAALQATLAVETSQRDIAQMVGTKIVGSIEELNATMVAAFTALQAAYVAAGQPASAAGRSPGEAAATPFVTGLYQSVLGRAPDTAGLAGWTGQIASGAMTQSQVQTAFQNSDEAYVNSLYQTVLGHAADPNYVGSWTALLQNGTITRDQAAAAFANSPEALANKGMALGGWVGNGVWNQDSVRARFAGGGDVALAGGEFVVSAPAAARYSDVLPSLNAGAIARNVSNDNSRLEALVTTLISRVERLERTTAAGHQGTIDVVKDGNRSSETGERRAALAGSVRNAAA